MFVLAAPQGVQTLELQFPKQGLNLCFLRWKADPHRLTAVEVQSSLLRTLVLAVAAGPQPWPRLCCSVLPRGCSCSYRPEGGILCLLLLLYVKEQLS